ncbi:methylthioadenosine phosphorylase [Gammaproteobacteria bacterium 45_16_T64]|nr:methylthioadenosine phosphorylase [Gammaproteobacteria bacterium 45_16_T64]
MLAIIGGSGLTTLDGLTLLESLNVETPYGATSAPIEKGVFAGRDVYFLARHGKNHGFAPHEVNYRANLWALESLGVTAIIGVNAVGGISAEMGPESIVIPDQLIDYTWGRESSFSSVGDVIHADFTFPYTQSLREQLLATAKEIELSVFSQGVYGVTQGPRLETAAEINKLEKDGCDIVGMTAMPEAILARELDLEYVNLSLVVNMAAGRSEGVITMDEIYRVLDIGMIHIRRLIAEAIKRIL